ncbi:MAG: amidoligase family protein [Pseudomonadota bacterium]
MQFKPLMPPRTQSEDGIERTVGFEFEFMGLKPREAAHVIVDTFGGTVSDDGPNAAIASTPDHGDFKVEIDSRYAHAPQSDDATSVFDTVRRAGAEAFGAVTRGIVPCEIVTPPLPLSVLDQLPLLERRLAVAGATGTRENALHAVGLHINPQVVSTSPTWLVGVVRAQILASAWLKEAMQIDVTRRLTGFAAPFDEAFINRIMTPDYAPSHDTLIDDYLRLSPTRNTELDLLPLLAHLDADRVRRALPDEKVRPRPTFHYRLPNAEIGNPNWSALREWNRWVLLEQIAADDAFLAETSDAYRRARRGAVSGPWQAAFADRVIAWLQGASSR